MKKPIIIDGKITNYEIYDDGRCYNKKFNRFLQGSVKNTGYRMVLLSFDGKKRDFSIHRLVAEAFIPNPNHLPIVNHKDGNKLNNTVNNLEWATTQDNTIHAIENNLISKRGKGIKYSGDLDGEIWTRYFDTNYSVSSLGRVRNDVTENLLCGSRAKNGYNRCSLRIDGETKEFLIHRLIYFGFNPTVQELKGYVVNHKDGDKSNNSLDNLEYITQSENVTHGKYILQSKSIKACSQFSLTGE